MFQYKVLVFHSYDPIEEKLNTLGKESWNIAALSHYNKSLLLILKKKTTGSNPA